jgi:16S rRNA (cytidine1402-2'-O)-methyltransferase
VALARELTKKFEEVWRGTLADAIAHLAEHEPRGEFVVVVEGAPVAPVDDLTDEVLLDALRAALAADDNRKAAVATVMAQTGAPKRRVYDLALQLPKSPR